MTRTIIDQGWVDAYQREAARLARDGMYLPDTEHASCGVGLVAAIDGTYLPSASGSVSPLIPSFGSLAKKRPALPSP